MWDALSPWDIDRQGLTFNIKVGDTVVGTEVLETRRDPRVTFEIHGTSNRRVIGYIATFSGEPLVLQRPRYIAVFYSKPTTEPREIHKVLYHDAKVRLLTFGVGDASDYLLVLRKR